MEIREARFVTVPAAVLNELAQMDEYDRLLSLERVASEHGVSIGEVEAALVAHMSGGASAGNMVLSDAGGEMAEGHVAAAGREDDMVMYTSQKMTEPASYEDILAAERTTTQSQDAAVGSAEWDSATPPPAGTAAQLLPDAGRYRLGYDPTSKGQQRQDMVQQAILCPACNAPLGIPMIRPIDVTCPECLTSTTFDS